MPLLDEFQTGVRVRRLTGEDRALEDGNAHGAEGEAYAAEGEAYAAVVGIFARRNF